MRRFLLAIAVTAIATSPVHAQTTLWSQLPDANTGWNISAGAYTIGWYAGDDFSLSAPATLQKIRFWTSLVGVVGTTVDWKIRSDASGAPGLVLGSGGGAALTTAASTEPCVSGYNCYSHVFDIGTVALGSGTYWLELFNTPGDINQFWATASSTNGSSAFHTGEGNIESDLAFEISGTSVPEPATFALMATGLAAMGAVARRRRRTA